MDEGKPVREPYCGATARIAFTDALKLGSDWACQPKKDGAYCTVHTDARGRVEYIRSRNGWYFPKLHTVDLIGMHVATTRVVLVGELECESEHGWDVAKERGYPLLHLFDVLHDGDRSMVREPQRVRRDRLHRMQVEAEDWTGKPISTRFPIVPQYSTHSVGRWFTEALDAGDEGLVLVNVNAPLGAPSSKRKLKRVDTLDALIVGGPDSWGYWAEWSGVRFVVAKSKTHAPGAGIGAIVEIAFEGFLRSGQPKHPRIIRRRFDLEPADHLLELDALPGDLAARLRPDAMTPVEPWRRERA